VNQWFKLIAAALVLWIYNGVPATEASCASGTAWCQTAQCQCSSQYCNCEEKAKDFTFGERQASLLPRQGSLKFTRLESRGFAPAHRAVYPGCLPRLSARPRAPPVAS